ncbi:MAG: HAD family hydrolase [Acidobacteria bacterium]|nr:MAG: HAD family hydrolase [Acidobacteriota bacterium]
MTCDLNRAVLCDLDDTLFDHAGATRDALAHVRTLSAELGRWTLDEFDRRHRITLETLHLEVLAGKWTIEDARIERFRRLLAEAGVDERRPAVLEDLSWGYRGAYEHAWRLVPGALALVGAIKDAGTRLAIVTNNVVREQRLKIERGGLAPFVDVLVTSEEFGATKPDPGIVHHALARVNAVAANAVMFGDSLTTDIEAGRRAGVRVVWFNRFGAISNDPSLAEVRSLEDPQTLALLTA